MTTKDNPTTDLARPKLVITRELNAPRERVWKAWTEPGQIQVWLQLGGGMTVESVQADLRAGGKFRIQQKMDDGEFFTSVGTYLEMNPPERLVYTWDWEKDGAGTEFGELEGNETRITVKFHAHGEGTQIVLTHEKLPSAESRERHQRGWGMWLDKLAKFVEAKQNQSTNER